MCKPVQTTSQLKSLRPNQRDLKRTDSYIDHTAIALYETETES